MSNRREFLLMGAVAAPVAALAGNALAHPAGAPQAQLYATIYDERFAPARAFGAQARRQGLATRAISGDVTSLWYDDLYHRWKKSPAAIAGLTTRGALFCLETFGADVGLRRVLHVAHRPDADGRIAHTLEGPADLLRQASLDACGVAWSGRMAQLAARCPATRKDRVETAAVSMDWTVAAGDEELVSWVLAPVRRV